MSKNKHRWEVEAHGPRVTIPDGGTWTACVLGHDDDEFGIALYSDPSDIYAIVDAHRLR
jgi:hypothetical protein